MKSNSNGHYSVSTVNDRQGSIETDSDDSTLTADELGAPTDDLNSHRGERRRRKRLIGGVLLLVMLAILGIAIYLMVGGRTPVNLRVRDTRPQEVNVGNSHRTLEDVTAEAIAEVRSSTPAPASSVPSLATGVTNNAPGVGASPIKEVPTDTPGVPITSVNNATVDEVTKVTPASSAGTVTVNVPRRNTERQFVVWRLLQPHLPPNLRTLRRTVNIASMSMSL
jgi:hypothetical protein